MIRVSFQIGGWLSILLACWLAQLTVDRSSWQPVPLTSHVGTHSSPVQALKAQPRPRIKPIHLVLLAASGKLKVYDPRGHLCFVCRASTRAINAGYGHYGSCPRGNYALGRTVVTNSPAFGRWAIPVYDLTSTGPLHQHHRTGIFVHSGGSTLLYPYEDYQPLLKTHGCIRLHNRSMREIVRINHCVRTRGNHLALTVTD